MEEPQISHADIQNQIISIRKQQNWMIMLALAIATSFGAVMYDQHGSMAATLYQLEVISEDLTTQRTINANTMATFNTGLFDLNKEMRDKNDETRTIVRDHAGNRRAHHD